jgi:hypothetical protein
MKILSFQPFSLYANGGGSRILRRIYQGRAQQIISLTVQGVMTPVKSGEFEEINVIAVPLTRWWMRWRLRNIAIYLRDKTFKPLTMNKIRKAAMDIQCDVIHMINHGPFSAALCDKKITSGKKIWVSFHDHFSTTYSSFADARQLWMMADRRLVISNELALEYQKLFGGGAYELITDGVTAEELSEPSESIESPVHIYFAGLLHLDYAPLFKTMADALDQLSGAGQKFKFVLRGTQRLDFLAGRKFETEYREVTLDNQVLKTELDESSILYLPIKFEVPDFYRFSLSTKMVGYLGGSGAIFYHGPADSAACHLIEKAGAGVCCTSLKTEDIVQALTSLLKNKKAISANAKVLAKTSFNLNKIQTRFWNG